MPKIDVRLVLERQMARQIQRLRELQSEYRKTKSVFKRSLATHEWENTRKAITRAGMRYLLFHGREENGTYRRLQYPPVRLKKIGYYSKHHKEIPAGDTTWVIRPENVFDNKCRTLDDDIVAPRASYKIAYSNETRTVRQHDTTRTDWVYPDSSNYLIGLVGTSDIKNWIGTYHKQALNSFLKIDHELPKQIATLGWGTGSYAKFEPVAWISVCYHEWINTYCALFLAIFCTKRTQWYDLPRELKKFIVCMIRDERVISWGPVNPFMTYSNFPPNLMIDRDDARVLELS